MDIKDQAISPIRKSNKTQDTNAQKLTELKS